MNVKRLPLIIVPVILLLVISSIILTRIWSWNPSNKSSDGTTSLGTDVPKQSFDESSYIFFGDSGTGDKTQAEVAFGIESYCKTHHCVAAFIAGDVIYNSGVKSVDDEQFKTKFEDPYKNLNLPFYIAFGNHDYQGCTYCYIEYSSKSTKWKMPQSAYRVPYNDITFWVVDTENFDASQAEWLKLGLDHPETPLNVVVGHRPYITFDKEHVNDNSWKGRENLKNNICNTANYYIAGHAHIMEYSALFDGCSVQQIVAGGGGAEPRDIIQPNTNKFSNKGNGFVALTVNKEKKVSVEYLDKDGKRLYLAEGK